MKQFIVFLGVVVLVAGVFMTPAFSSADEKVKIAAIAMDSRAIPFILDNNGDVWAFRHPLTLYGSTKLSHLHHIKKLAAFMALSEDGHVYTWALSKKSTYASEELDEAVYTMPEQVKGLSDVSDIDESANHFVAVVNHNQVYEWRNRKINLKTKMIVNSSPRLVFMHDNIKAVATSDHSTIALLGDKTIVGWGDNHQAQLGSDGPEVISPQSPVTFEAPEAVAKIYMSKLHAIALSDSGHAFFWGNCVQINGLKAEGIKGAQGAVDDIVDMAIDRFDDNQDPNVFVKKDGSVWLAYAPMPRNKKQCVTSTTLYDYHAPSYRIEGMTEKAKAVAVADDGGEVHFVVYAIGVDNTFWRTKEGHFNEGFEKISLDLSNYTKE